MAAAPDGPDITFTHADEGDGGVSDALDALAAADVIEEDEDDAQLPGTPAEPALEGDRPGRRPPPKPRDRSAPKIERLTAKRYKNVRLDAAHTMLHDRDLEIRELRDKIRLQEATPPAPAMPPVSIDIVADAVVELCACIADLVALFSKVDEVRLSPEEKQELRELAGPAFAPFVGDWAKWLPIASFFMRFTTLTADRVFLIKAAKAEARQTKLHPQGIAEQPADRTRDVRTVVIDRELARA